MKFPLVAHRYQHLAMLIFLNSDVLMTVPLYAIVVTSMTSFEVTSFFVTYLFKFLAHYWATFFLLIYKEESCVKGSSPACPGCRMDCTCKGQSYQRLIRETVVGWKAEQI